VFHKIKQGLEVGITRNWVVEARIPDLNLGACTHTLFGVMEQKASNEATRDAVNSLAIHTE